jgi:alpha-glucosidase
LATLLLTPRDAALIYYGEELGMVTDTPKRKEDVRDPIGRIGWPKEKGRDGERSPMPWTSGKNGGFSDGSATWLPVPSNYKTVNVESERRDPGSLLNYYKRLIRLRKQNLQLRDGEFILVNEDSNDVLSFIRKTTNNQAVLVVLNMTAKQQTASIDLSAQGNPGNHLRTLIASYANAKPADIGHIVLPPYGSYVGQVEK